MSLSNELLSKTEEWLKWDQNGKDSEEIRSLVQEGKVAELEDRMLTRLQFGTAGLRGRMGAGYNRINDLVVIQTSQGLVKYLLRQFPGAGEKGIVVGHDSRHNSHRFARLAARVFLLAGVRVYLLGEICPTPFVPFSVKEFSAAAGVMVTASHNPKDDNGYKVYWTNSAQIIPPHDIGIQTSIEEHLEPWEGVWDVEAALRDDRLSDPLDNVMQLYYERLANAMLDTEKNANTTLRFTVTAMHGVGHRYMKKAFQACGFKEFVPVKEQMDPNPDFPTVVFPNPEEGKSALDLSFAAADAANSTVILANDPDADRLAVALKISSGWKVLTGNEEGALFGWWAWQRCRLRHPDLPADDVYMLASTVSSKILAAIASTEGFHFEETLTGFKWMCNRAVDLMNHGKTVLFAFEEAIGFMNGVEVLDKDGISAGIFMAELAAHLEQEGITIEQQLKNIYDKYGYHVSNNSYFLCYEPETVKELFTCMRNMSGPNKYPASVCGGKYKVVGVRDLTLGYSSDTPDHVPTLPVCPDSQMITLTFSNGSVMTIRTSGTEPKIKYYSELCGSPGQKNWSAMKEELDELVAGAIHELLAPEKYGLLPRPE